MATRYVTLKDSNGDTIYPQAIATIYAPSWANKVQVLANDQSSGTFTYTAPSDGVLYLSTAAANSRVFLSIDLTPSGTSTSFRVASVAVASPGTPNTQFTTTITMAKGDTVATGTLSANMSVTNATWFVPWKNA